MPEAKIIPALALIRDRRLNGEPRAKTIRAFSFLRGERRADTEPVARGIKRPAQRSDCINGPRPCPWVSCEYHLYLDVNHRNGSLTINFPDLEPWELPATCALDVALGGARTLSEVGDVIGLSRERVHQIEEEAKAKLRAVEEPATEGELSAMTLFEQAREDGGKR
jgi:hypothetical protein